MTQSQFSLAWDSFKSNICSGFSALQQNGEFVDMTLAADGHLVKVHQVLVALASPYIKDMIASASCPHPVIYLNNVSHKVLCYLLEYIYTGEVIVPCDLLPAFGEAAQSLHIKGLENINGATEYTENSSRLATPLMQRSLPTVETTNYSRSTKRKAQYTYEQQVTLPSAARKIFIKAEGPISLKDMEPAEGTHDYSSAMDDTPTYSDDIFKQEITHNSMDTEKLKYSVVQYSITERGCIELILNRFMYCCHHKTRSKRRWRCIDYRRGSCKALIDTVNGVITASKGMHVHPFHDMKIMKKRKKGLIFPTVELAIAAKDLKKKKL